MRGNRTPRLGPITPLQERIIRLIATGSTAKQAAAEIGLKVSAIDNQLIAIHKKAKCSNRVELVHFALRTGRVELIRPSGPVG